jgi:hypothetical protein
MRSETRGKRQLAGAVIPALLIAAPAAIFYSSLFSHLVNLPFYDDYNALLRFLNEAALAKGAAAKFWVFLAGQHNEYKLFFVHGLALAQVELLGHVDFVQLCMLGDSAVLVLAFQLWSMFLQSEKDLARRMALFVPVAWLIFQLSYWETLTWAMAALQNLWVIVFSLGTIRCLLQPSRKSYAGALILYALAIAASGNGFLLLPLGLVILATRRQIARAAGWLACTAGCIAAYAYHYNVMSSQARSRGSVFSTLMHLRPDYSIAFIGNAGAIAGSSPISVWISLTLGAVLLLFFGWLAWRGYARRNPMVSCCVLFLMLTAVGVAGMRSDYGLIQSTSSRYTIYGALAVIFAWTAICEEFLELRDEMLLNSGPYLAMMIGTVLLSFWMDGIGYRELVGRKHEVVNWMAAYERPGTPESADSPMPPFKQQSAATIEWRAQAREILKESVQLGVYELPKH